MPDDRFSIINPRVMFGLCVAAAGVLFTLDNIGLLRASEFVRFWPCALLLIGAAKIAQARDSWGNTLGVIWIVAGGVLLLATLGVLRIDLRDYWPLILVLIGARMVLRPPRARPANPTGRAADSTGRAADPTGRAADPTGFVHAAVGPIGAFRRPVSSSSVLNAVAIMSGIERKSDAVDFKGGDLTAIMGGCEIDLRRAEIQSGGEAVFDVFVMMGGVEVRVPEDWTVVTRVLPLMGGFEDRTHQPVDSSRRLVVQGLVVMGGVEIKN